MQCVSYMSKPVNAVLNWKYNVPFQTHIFISGDHIEMFACFNVHESHPALTDQLPQVPDNAHSRTLEEQTTNHLIQITSFSPVLRCTVTDYYRCFSYFVHLIYVNKRGLNNRTPLCIAPQTAFSYIWFSQHL